MFIVLNRDRASLLRPETPGAWDNSIGNPGASAELIYKDKQSYPGDCEVLRPIPPLASKFEVILSAVLSNRTTFPASHLHDSGLQPAGQCLQ
jgi:hypothetical protein